MIEPAGFDPQLVRELVEHTMPFGKYKGLKLIDLPEPYVVWFQGQGWPPGKLGQQLGFLYEIKVNGLEQMVREVSRQLGSSC